jgi:hypothetical protein
MIPYSLIAIFLLCGSSFGYTIVDNTDVGKGKAWTDTDDYLGLTDYLGEEFDIHKIDMNLTGSLLDISIESDFDGYWSSGGLTLHAADLFLNLDGNDDTGIYGYELGITFTDEYLSKGSIYEVITVRSSHDVVEGKGNWIYGEYWGDDSTPHPIVQIMTGKLKGEVESYNFGITGDPPYTWTLSIDLEPLGFDYNNDIGVFLASATCANDIIEGKFPAPEPASMLLLGTGLIGLAGLSKKKWSNRKIKYS